MSNAAVAPTGPVGSGVLKTVGRYAALMMDVTSVLWLPGVS